MEDKNNNGKPSDESKSAGQILPKEEKHLKDKMPDHLKSPMNDLKDKSDVVSK